MTHATVRGLGRVDPRCPDDDPGVLVSTHAEFTARADACPRCASTLLAIASCMATVSACGTDAKRKPRRTPRRSR